MIHKTSKLGFEPEREENRARNPFNVAWENTSWCCRQCPLHQLGGRGLGRHHDADHPFAAHHAHGLTLRDINEVPELGLGFNDSEGLLGLDAEPNE